MPELGLGLGLNMWLNSAPLRQDFGDFSSLKLDLNPDILTAGVVGTFANSGPAGGQFTAAGSARPTCVADFYGGHKALDFDGTDDAMTSSFAGSAIISAAAYTLLWVVHIDAINTNAAAPYDNDAVVSIGAQFCGMHLNSVPQLQGYHWDGNADISAVSTTVGARILLQQRYDGTKIYARSGSDAEAAGTTSGNVNDLTGTCGLGRNYNAAALFDGKILRGLAFNANLAATAGLLELARARLAALYGVAA